MDGKNELVEKHDLEQVWEAQRQTSNDVSELKSAMSGMMASVQSLSDNVAAISNHIANNKPREINWVGIFGVVISAIMAAAFYQQARLKPIEDDIGIHAEIFMSQLDSLRDNAYLAGQQQAKIEVIERLQSDVKGRLHGLEERTASSVTSIDFLTNWIKDVDVMGSRKHVMSIPDSAKEK